MEKTLKTFISIILSFALIFCLEPVCAGATELSTKEDEIAAASYNIGTQYNITDKYGKITAWFIDSNRLVISYQNTTPNNRYIEMCVYSSNKNFANRGYTVKAGASHSETYSLNINTAGQIRIELYRHLTTSPSSGQIDPLVGRMQ